MKIHVLMIALFAFVLLHPLIAAARSTAKLSFCTYTGKRENPAIFQGPSISKYEIRECLKAKIPIKNHHIFFEDYRDAWQTLAEETGNYTIPLKIHGGLLHNTPFEVETNTGGIRLWEFRDPTVKDASVFTDEQRKTFRVIEKGATISLIRPEITWEGVFISSTINVIPEGGNTDLTYPIFTNEVNFQGVTFLDTVHFHWSSFGDKVSFSESSFEKSSDFSRVYFNNKAFFTTIKSHNSIDFDGAHFNDNSYFFRSTFSGESNFKDIIFKGTSDFRWCNFIGNPYFYTSVFSKKTFFSKATFSGSQLQFRDAQFKDDTDFKDVIISGNLYLSDTSWEGDIDFRRIRVREIYWDSIKNLSNVKGILDMREAQIGSATFREVRFHDLIDFTRTTFGQFSMKDRAGKDKIYRHPKPRVLFENVIFEKESDFLQIKGKTPIVFINNRFRSTLDFTGSLFESRNSQVQNFHLCLSFNRITRLRLEPESLGNPPGISPFQQFISLFTNSLHTSQVRHIHSPECLSPKNAAQEPLHNIYKTLGKSFRESNDRAGINESWYLETLAKRRNEPKFWSILSWLLGDIPSRYTVDVWRPLWVSLSIIICFYFLYLIRFVYLKGFVQIPKPPNYPERYKTFRLRLFEPIHAKEPQTKRTINPWTDAALLSMRAFLKLGLGSTYPYTRGLKIITTIEWILGAYMLIHFLLALKNNLPFILPFLGVVN